MGTWDAVFAIFSASICRVICIRIMRIIVAMIHITNNIFRIRARLLASGSDTRASILLIIGVVWIAISMMTSRHILIILYQRTFCHIVIIIETLTNILYLSRL